jgi:peptide/nickel transport system ATP-binding protein/oligopeptide transport system ATP-binding protein
MDAAAPQPILEVRDLQTHIVGQRGVGRAVDRVSFTLRAGETLGLVGESGSGKSLTCLSIVRLNPQPASRIVGGEVLFGGEDLFKLSEQEMRRVRGRRIAMVLQDPMSSLNPVFTIGNQIAEVLRLHQGARGSRVGELAAEMLRRLRIPDPERALRNYPHELSGGMRQRAVGSIALAGTPEVLLADEPTTALDVTIQVAYLELLKQLQRETNLAILFVTHDFNVVARICDRVAVMYAGRIVETTDTATLFSAPRHPYTKALLASVPDVERKVDRLEPIAGQPPSTFELHPGCPFAPRCREADARCEREEPPEVRLAPAHNARCWRYA